MHIPELFTAFDSSGAQGGEEFVEGTRKRSPSAQIRTSPSGEVVPISTHEQILGGDSDQIFLGARFPAE